MLVLLMTLASGMCLISRDADDLAMEMTDVPNIWTDGSREDYPVGGFEVAGAGVCLPAPELAMDGAAGGVAEGCCHGRVERCRAFMSEPGPMQTVQRAEFWGVIVAHSFIGLATWV